jgi:N-acetylglucosamine-6-phosphate deacetylase
VHINNHNQLQKEHNIQVPGFVDLQVNGFCGVDFSSPNLIEEDFIRATHLLVTEGTACFLPTVITSPLSVYKRNLPLIAHLIECLDLKGRMPGIHIEGPFISSKSGARGIHNPRWIRKPDIELLKRLESLSMGKIKLITVAAELEGAEQLIEYAVNRGITVSLGHQMATSQEIEKAECAGASALTHFGNGVPALLNRHNNPLWGGLVADELSAMIISDGFHLPDSLIKIIIRVKGIEKLIVTSDVSPVAGLLPGTYTSMGKKVLLERSGLLFDPETGYLAGSSKTMYKCLNQLGSNDLLKYEEILQVGFHNPLSLIGVRPESIPAGCLIGYDYDIKEFYPIGSEGKQEDCGR